MTVSIMTVIMGMAIAMINTFPANSILEAMAPWPASRVTWAANSAI